MSRVKVGVIGCGMISEVYMKNCKERFDNLELVACADLVEEAARRRAEQFQIRACTVEELLADPQIEIVLNLTIPSEHAKVSLQALKAGKSAYSEKPFATNYEEGLALLAYAKEHHLLVGSAPDTFMGDGLQTCARILEEGKIGRPFAGQAFMLSRGPESFHPNPEFFYQPGAGPLLDWGPYYITTLVALLGPVKCVTGVGRITYPVRKVKSAKSPRFGQEFPVEVPTYLAGILEFANEAVVNLTMSFDMQFPYWESELPYIRIYGTEGTLSLPDVNKFEGPVMLRQGDKGSVELKVEGNFTENCRGMGLADMAHCLRTGEPYRTNGELAFHVSEILLGLSESARTKERYILKTTCERPKLLPAGLLPGMYTKGEDGK